MSDQYLRRLERQMNPTKDITDITRWLHQKHKSGLLPDQQLKILSLMGYPAARELDPGLPILTFDKSNKDHYIIWKHWKRIVRNYGKMPCIVLGYAAVEFVLNNTNFPYEEWVTSYPTLLPEITFTFQKIKEYIENPILENKKLAISTFTEFPFPKNRMILLINDFYRLIKRGDHWSRSAMVAQSAHGLWETHYWYSQEDNSEYQYKEFSAIFENHIKNEIIKWILTG